MRFLQIGGTHPDCCGMPKGRLALAVANWLCGWWELSRAQARVKEKVGIVYEPAQTSSGGNASVIYRRLCPWSKLAGLTMIMNSHPHRVTAILSYCAI